MCTVTWWRDASDDSFGVWFNRDERRTRPASEPVRLQHTTDGTAFLAPRDPAAGGTWLLANAHGLVVGVLNHYAAIVDTARPSTTIYSRGHLPLRFAGCRSVAEVDRLAQAMTPGQFAPFIMIAWDRVRTATWLWDSARLLVDPAPPPPLTTSSHRSVDVTAWRRARYAAVVARLSAEALAAYHDDIAHADPAFNVRMRRPDACTESVCRVLVTPAAVRFFHRRESPEALAARDSHEVALARP
jgi:Transport and Golgi organisation 2